MTAVTKNLFFGCAVVLLMAGSAVTALPHVQAGDVLVAGNHSNYGNKDKDKKHQNNNKKGAKSKGNNGVRDHGKGEGKDNAGQGKGQGHKNKK